MAEEAAPVTATSRNLYHFRRATPAERLEPYSCTAYSCDKHQVNTLQGDPIYTGNDTIVDMALSPTGINFSVVTRDKKGRNKMYVYNTMTLDEKLAEFDVKKYGQPRSVCYTPDGRNILVATDTTVYMIEPVKYQVTDRISGIPFAPKRMAMSPNGYYLAMWNGPAVAIMNYENKTLRRKLNVGETVNDLAFSPQSDEMGVLTADGVLSLYNTRTFDIKKMIDDLGDGLACAYNFDGKYIATAVNPGSVAVVNILRDSDRDYINSETGGISDICFLTDIKRNTLMGYPVAGGIEFRRMPNLKPYYNKLIADEADRKMDEWLKMMPGETMEQYRGRVTDETRRRQRQLFEDEIATGFAGDLMSEMGMSLGSYDRTNGVLALNFESMPTIFIPVPEADVTTFGGVDDIALSDVQYGILPDDSFEVVYAKMTNKKTGNVYIYDNHNRTSLDHIDADDAISIELLQQQQMEEVKLQEIKEQVIEEAKSSNVISDHTNIAVNSKVVPDYDADGKKILNYNVNFTYDVEPEFSAVEDFGPGKYHVEESGAASSMLKIVKQAFEGDFKRYVTAGKKLRVNILGTADSSPILRGIPYDGYYGDIENEPVYKDGQLTTISVTKKDGIKENDQLALLRALGVKDFLEKNVEGYKDLSTDYRYNVNVSKDKGSAFRRITVEFTFVDAY